MLHSSTVLCSAAMQTEESENVHVFCRCDMMPCRPWTPDGKRCYICGQNCDKFSAVNDPSPRDLLESLTCDRDCDKMVVTSAGPAAVWQNKRTGLFAFIGEHNGRPWERKVIFQLIFSMIFPPKGLPEQRHQGAPLLHIHRGRVARRAGLQKASRRWCICSLVHWDDSSWKCTLFWSIIVVLWIFFQILPQAKFW